MKKFHDSLRKWASGVIPLLKITQKPTAKKHLKPRATNRIKTRSIASWTLCVLGAVLLTNCTPFALNVIRYQQPGIEDHQIFFKRTIKAGSPKTWSLAKNYNKTSLDAALVKEIESYGTAAFVIVQNGELLYERYWDGHDAKTYSASFSMAKSILSLLVGIALEEGKIRNLDQAVADFIPEFKDKTKSEITLRHLLTMTSGLAWDEAYDSVVSPTAQLYYGDDLRQLVTTLPSKHPPGTVWYYSSADSQILGMALEAATDKTLSEYASEKLWQHIGAEQDASWSLDHENGVTKANCCFNSTPRDFVRLGQLVLQHGEWQGKQLVPKSYLTTASQSVLGLRDAQRNNVDYYGYQFWIGKFDNQPMPFMNGILGQYIFVIPHLNAVVLRLGQRDSPDFKDVEIYHQAALKILRDNQKP